MTREEAIRRFQQMKKILSIPNSDAERTIEAIDMAIEALSAERTGWIPCGERLPSGADQVLVTALWREPFVNYEVTLGEHWNNGEAWGDWKDGEIIAWMPLPDAYKGGDDE